MKNIDILFCNDIRKKALRYVFENNTSNSAPYHSMNHMLYVTKNIFNAVIYYDKFKTVEINSMIIAGLFHDMNHTQGNESDKENVKIALNCFNNFYSSLSDQEKETELYEDIVVDMIKATEFPYVIDAKDLNLYQRIIRDADIMMGFESNWIDTIVFGLKKELSINSNLDVIKLCIKFQQNVKYNTKWGNKIRKENLNTLNKDLNCLHDILS